MLVAQHVAQHVALVVQHVAQLVANDRVKINLPSIFFFSFVLQGLEEKSKVWFTQTYHDNC
jgi:hypothetical protein